MITALPSTTIQTEKEDETLNTSDAKWFSLQLTSQWIVMNQNYFVHCFLTKLFCSFNCFVHCPPPFNFVFMPLAKTIKHNFRGHRQISFEMSQTQQGNVLYSKRAARHVLPHVVHSVCYRVPLSHVTWVTFLLGRIGLASDSNHFKGFSIMCSKSLTF